MCQTSYGDCLLVLNYAVLRLDTHGCHPCRCKITGGSEGRIVAAAVWHVDEVTKVSRIYLNKLVRIRRCAGSAGWVWHSSRDCKDIVAC